jgi:tRNA modification GTPase
VAIATPPGEGGVAIVRLSGPDSPRILREMFGRKHCAWASHHMYYGAIQQSDGTVIDQGLAVRMQAPHSFTGEDVAELHLHGGAALAQLAVHSCLRLGARLAQPGEFTMRAFLNGKLDLSQAEAVQQLIQSRSSLAAQMATRNLQGYFSSQVGTVREDLLHWLAMLEAELDFGDEVPSLPLEVSRRRLQRARSSVERLLQQGEAGKALTDGLRTVILGAPNAGKSTLLNLLLGRERALVTPVAGTTRDTLEETLVIGGIPLVLVDTAGVRQETSDVVEQLGIQRSREEVAQADLVLWVLDGSAPAPPPESETALVTSKARLALLNKRDLGLAPWTADYPGLHVSLLQQQGVEELFAALGAEIRKVSGEQQDVMRLTQRQWEALQLASEALGRLAETLEAGLSAEFLALDLRAAVHALGQIQGLEVTEEVLDRIFSTFCLGK